MAPRIILRALPESDCSDFTLQSCNCFTHIRNSLLIKMIVVAVVQDELQRGQCTPGYAIFHRDCDHSASSDRMNLKHNSRQEKLEGRLFYYSPTPTLDGLAEDIGQWP